MGEDGVRDLEEALEIARATNSPLAATALNNLAVAAAQNDIRRETELMEESRRVSERMGDRDTMRFTDGNLVWCRWATGHWDEAFAAANAFIAECERGSPHYLEEHIRSVRADILVARGHVEESLEDGRVAIEHARCAHDPQARLPSVALCAMRYVWLGRLAEAKTLADEFVAGIQALEEAPMFVAILTGAAETLGIAAELRPLVERLPSSLFKAAAIAELDGEFVQAADVWADLGFLPREASTRLRAAERMIGDGQRAEGAAQLQQALAFFRSVDATFFVRRGEALLAEAQSESA
jgi:hypothetical protein